MTVCLTTRLECASHSSGLVPTRMCGDLNMNALHMSTMSTASRSVDRVDKAGVVCYGQGRRAWAEGTGGCIDIRQKESSYPERTDELGVSHMTDDDINVNTLPHGLVNEIAGARITNVLNPELGITLEQSNAMFILAFRSVRAGERPTFDQLLAAST